MSIFSYWTTDDLPHRYPMPEEAELAWRSRVAGYKVHNDAAAEEALQAWGEGAIEIFRAVRIPACRSDLARLALLHRHGGVYVDAHCGPGDMTALHELVGLSAERELVVFDESFDACEYRNTCIVNGILGGRAGAAVLHTLVACALGNLRAQRQAEGSGLAAPYSIYKLTGPWMIWHELYRRVAVGAELKQEFQKRVAIWPYQPDANVRPVVTDRFGAHRTKTSHWSVRELTEPLFRR